MATTFTLTAQLLWPDTHGHKNRYVTITPNAPLVRDKAGNRLHFAPRSYKLGATGALSVALVADGVDSSIPPGALQYTVNLGDDVPPISFTAPAAGTTVDLADVAPLLDVASIGMTAESFLADSHAYADAIRSSLVKPSPNLVNPDAAQTGYTLNSLGAAVPSPAYTVTGFVPVTPGLNYTLSNPRNYEFYTSAKTQLAGSYVSNSTSALVTVTAPPDAAFLRASWLHATFPQFMIAQGSTLPPWQPYGFEDLTPAMESLVRNAVGDITTGGPLAVTLANDGALTITEDLAGKPLTINADLSSPTANGLFQFGAVTYGPLEVTRATDDVTPIRTQAGTVAGNHGIPTVRSFANPDGKTTADLGSVWTDGTREYVLLKIEPSGRLILGGSYTRDSNGLVTTATVSPTAALNHVSGATKTGTIDQTTATATQLYPTLIRSRVRLFLDDKPATAPITSTQATRVTVRESGEVLDYASLYDTMKANPGKPYTTLPVTGAVLVETAYEFGPQGTCTVTTDLTELAPTRLDAAGIVQAQALTVPGHARRRIMPGVKPLNGMDLGAGIDAAAWTSSAVVKAADLVHPGQPPVVDLEWAVDAHGDPVIGFAIGLDPHANAATDTTQRITHAATNLWDVRSTQKHYPTAWASRAPGWGHLRGRGFRAYVPPATVAAVAATRHPMAAWAALSTTTGMQ